MKILLLGPQGQVGWELQRALAPLGQVVAAGRPEADLARPKVLQAMLEREQPHAIVNAAAYTAVDQAETEPALAHAVNAGAPSLLARHAAAHGAWLLHYSTDYVFDGSGAQARDEAAATGPLSVYGATKLAGEVAIRASGCRHLILRTSWVHAARGGNFARTMLWLAMERDQLRVINDQIGAPTGADLLADVAAHALRAAIADPALAGTYHVCAGGHTSWFDYARHVLSWAQGQGLALRVPANQVQAIPTTAYPTPAQRPLNSRLDTCKLRQAFNLHLPNWQLGVDRMLAEILPTLPGA